MTIQFASDLHLEFIENRNHLKKNPLVPRGDILIIAGDAIYLGDRIMSQSSFFNWCSAHFSETLIVPGNHEFYGGFDISETMDNFELMLRPNVRYLNNRSWRLGDVELFFTTLWPHYDSPIQKLNAEMIMNDYNYGVYMGKKYSAFAANKVHDICTAWLGKALSDSDASKRVVVSHHCPFIDPEKERYVGKTAAPSYMTDMEPFILEHQPDAWIHAHCHFIRSNGVMVGKTAIHSNPLGYTFDEEDAAFDNEKTLSI